MDERYGNECTNIWRSYLNKIIVLFYFRCSLVPELEPIFYRKLIAKIINWISIKSYTAQGWWTKLIHQWCTKVTFLRRSLIFSPYGSERISYTISRSSSNGWGNPIQTWMIILSLYGFRAGPDPMRQRCAPLAE